MTAAREIVQRVDRGVAVELMGPIVAHSTNTARQLDVPVGVEVARGHRIKIQAARGPSRSMRLHRAAALEG